RVVLRRVEWRRRAAALRGADRGMEVTRCSGSERCCRCCGQRLSAIGRHGHCRPCELPVGAWRQESDGTRPARSLDDVVLAVRPRRPDAPGVPLVALVALVALRTL